MDLMYRRLGGLGIALLMVALLGGCGGGGGGGGGGDDTSGESDDDPDDGDDTAGGDDTDDTDDTDDASTAAFSPDRFFVGNDGSSGNSDATQLWRTDGTEDGTVLVRDIRTGDDDELKAFTRANDRVFFTANDGTGEQLWVSAGGEDDTVKMTSGDLEPETWPVFLTALNDSILFRGVKAGDNTSELWVSDGTPEGTEIVMDIHPGEDVAPALLTALGDFVYFSANDGDVGQEFWRSDGTAANTELVVEIQEETGLGSLYNECARDMVVMNGELYFAAHDGVHGCELWKSDGSLGNAELVKDIAPGTTAGSRPHDFAVAGELLFFYAGASDMDDPMRLWMSDGTADGTVLVMEPDDDRAPLDGKENPIVGAGDVAYFQVNNKDEHFGSALELWYADGTDMGRVVAMEESVLGDGIDMAASGDSLYYIAKRDDEPGDFISPNRGLWKANGAVTELLSSFSGSNGGKPLIAVGDGATLLFDVADEMWRTDGTEAGTVVVKDICPPLECDGFIDP